MRSSDHAHSDHAHSDHERQLAKIMAEVGSSTSIPGVSLHEWLDENSKVSKESLNDGKHGKENRKRFAKVDIALKHLSMWHAYGNIG